NVRIVIALEISDACEISSVGNSADVKLSAGSVDDLRKSDHGGHFSCLMYQLDKEIFFHYISIHGNIAVRCASAVLFDGLHTLLFVQVQNIAVQESFLGVVDRVIEKSDISSGLNMCFKEVSVIRSVNHIVRRDYHIWKM